MSSCTIKVAASPVLILLCFYKRKDLFPSEELEGGRSIFLNQIKLQLTCSFYSIGCTLPYFACFKKSKGWKQLQNHINIYCNLSDLVMNDCGCFFSNEKKLFTDLMERYKVLGKHGRPVVDPTSESFLK